MVDFLVISDFNVQNLVAIINKIGRADGLRADGSAYGQVMQTLLAPDAGAWQSHDAAIIWTSPSAISNAYRLAVEGEPLDADKLSMEVAAFASALRRIPPQVQHVFVPAWIPLQPSEDRRGALDMDRDYGIAAALMRMNLELREALQSDCRVRIFNTARWVARIGEPAYSAKLWYLSKTPFSVDLFREAAKDFAAAMRGLSGKSRKLLIVDLDDTLWGGVVGETGWRSLKLGGHDPVGESYRDFQLALRSLRRRGVLLGIVSKNDEAIALEAIRENPEMVLALDDFAGWRINWNDKAQNVIELIEELNLGHDAAVFIDDHPAERARVREAIPELLVPEWPKSPLEFPASLRRLDCFDVALVSAEDRDRTSSYVSERQRKEGQAAAPSLDAWLKTLDLRIDVEPLTPTNLERAAQLFNKTNQMNLRTRRMSARELQQWNSHPGNTVVTFRVKDKLGDYGLVGIGSVVVNREARTAAIEDFLLSCRAMGRRVEEAMLSTLASISLRSGADEMNARYIETPRNKPCLRFFESCCERRGERPAELLFHFDLRRPPQFPDCVTMVGLDRVAPSVEGGADTWSRIGCGERLPT
jgi:FkbH-like protein